MMGNKAILSLEHLTQDVVSSKSDLVRINKDVYAVIRPNEILYVNRKDLDSFKEYFIPTREERGRNELSVTFVPTLDCNLSCIYCYSRGGEQRDLMPPSMARKFLEKSYNPEKHSGIHLRFAGGGEPFLNFECINEATETAKKLNHTVSLHCITNGTFNGEHLFWILKEKPHMRISYDGISQKIQRPYRFGGDSSGVIRRNIQYLTDNGIETVVQSTITSLNVSRMRELVSEFHDLGIRTVKMEPVYITDNSRGNKKLNVSPSDFVLNFLDAIKYIRENNLDMQVDTAFFSRPTLGNYCNLSTGNLILTPNGDISGCVEITNSCDYHSGDVFYGKFDEDSGEVKFDESKKKYFGKFHFTNYKDCPSCNLKLICRGGCPLRRVWNQEGHFCEITKRLVPQLLRLFYEDSSYAKIFIKNKVIK